MRIRSEDVTTHEIPRFLVCTLNRIAHIMWILVQLVFVTLQRVAIVFYMRRNRETLLPGQLLLRVC